MKTHSVAIFAVMFALASPAIARGEEKGTYQRIKVHGRALEGNLEGDSPDRDVSIYLPAGYQTDRSRRPSPCPRHCGSTNRSSR